MCYLCKIFNCFWVLLWKLALLFKFYSNALSCIFIVNFQLNKLFFVEQISVSSTKDRKWTRQWIKWRLWWREEWLTTQPSVDIRNRSSNGEYVFHHCPWQDTMHWAFFNQPMIKLPQEYFKFFLQMRFSNWSYRVFCTSLQLKLKCRSDGDKLCVLDSLSQWACFECQCVVRTCIGVKNSGI